MTPTLDPSAISAANGFSSEQKEYLSGFMAGVAQRMRMPDSTAPAPQHANTRPETVHGRPVDDLCKQERWKHEEHPLDGWDRVTAHVEANKSPDEENTYRFRNFGMFYVAPAQDSFMLRCRIPAGELTSAQLRGLAGLAEEFGNGKGAITTRSNIQIREIAPRNLVNVWTRLQSLALTSKGSGVDNVRNITASPTAGIDPQELIDSRPFAHALHHYILNQRDLYDLPRKFNVAFEGGGAIDTVADTNDIGFFAVKVTGGCVEPGIYFRIQLAGITGHKQLASDAGIIVQPSQSVAMAAAMIRVFIENGDRTDRKKARLKYLIDKWGIKKFLEETQRKLAFPLVRLSLEACSQRHAPVRHGHVGVYRQKQKGRNYIGVVIPVGMMTARQMRRLADLAENYGSGEVRLTPWQNLIIPNIADGFVETVKRGLVRIGFHYEATTIAGGLVACTGNKGCKWAATDTKGQAVALANYLEQRVQLDQPINIHLTGCPHSCAQHYIGDIGLMGVKTKLGAESVEAYNVVFGGGCGHEQAIGKEVFKGISFSALPQLLEHVLLTYKQRRNAGESFAQFARRHDVKQLQELFSE
jgi:ferredoxin-nitrite reductase